MNGVYRGGSYSNTASLGCVPNRIGYRRNNRALNYVGSGVGFRVCEWCIKRWRI